MVSNYQQIYAEFAAADEAWQACLVRTFGKQAGDIRYTKLGHTHPDCADAYNRFRKARSAWYTSLHEENPRKDKQ